MRGSGYETTGGYIASSIMLVILKAICAGVDFGSGTKTSKGSATADLFSASGSQTCPQMKG